MDADIDFAPWSHRELQVEPGMGAFAPESVQLLVLGFFKGWPALALCCVSPEM